jgi:hypothetical protein
VEEILCDAHGGRESASLRIKDDQGRDRLVLRVNAEGSPVIQFLDADGNRNHYLRRRTRHTPSGALNFECC